MAELIFEQGAMKGDQRCGQKLLNIKFQSLRKEEITIDDFFTLLDQLEESNKEWPFINYMRGKVHEKGVQTDRNIKKAVEQYRLGMLKGCQKCKASVEKFDNPSNSQQSSLH